MYCILSSKVNRGSKLIKLSDRKSFLLNATESIIFLLQNWFVISFSVTMETTIAAADFV